MKSHLTFRYVTLACASLLLAGSRHCGAQGGLTPPPAISPAQAAAIPVQPGTAPSGIYNQPVVVNSFEKVEMERLRITEEVGKAEREDLAFREQHLRLQKKLASSSLSIAAPESIPTDYRTFLSMSEGNIEKSKQYYALLKSTLNDLTPESPYMAHTAKEGSNPRRAAENLLRLDGFAEDDGISRTLRGHLAEFYGGRVDDKTRIRNIDAELATLAAEKKQIQWNYKMTYDINSFTQQPRGSEADRERLQKNIDGVTEKEEQLKKEKLTLHHVVTEIQRKLQFQQFIVELAFQQRYIHALIACGFYRGSPSRGDLSLSKDAYPSGRNKGPAPAGNDPFGGPTPASAIPSADIPIISTISGMESFLTNRIRDAMKDREAMDNMLKEKQMSAAESLLRKMVMTAKYQPELNTIPYASRQRIHGYGQDMRSLADALSAKDYQEMSKLADRIEQGGTDAGMKDIKLFATEHPKKALYLVRQAELSLKAGDRKSAQTMTDAAMQRAPLDPEVNAKIQQMQTSFLSNTKLAEELEKIVETGDYQSAFSRMNEFAPLASAATDKTLKSRYERLIEQEKSIRTTLEKCDAFERRSSYPDVWLALCGVEPGLAEDVRLVKRKNSISGKCPRFVSAYTKATEKEQTGADSIALAWYLSALSEAPGNTELVDKVNNLGTKLLNN